MKDHLEKADGPVPVPSGLRDRLSLLLVRVGDQIAQRGEERLQSEAGISGRDFSALAIVATDKPRSQLELSRMLGKAPALCVAMLDDLEGAGLVERVRDPDDRRRSIVSLTSQGRSKLDDADAIAREVEAEVLDGLSADELEAFGDLARRSITQTTTLYGA